MSTDMTWQMLSTSYADTEALGERIGHRLRGGEAIELVSDLGGGKTTFTRGFVRGAGSTDTVASPTFTISREYHTPKLTIVHFDFYRLTEAGVVAEELAEFIDNPEVVVVVEWADIVQDVLPAKRLTIHFGHKSESERIITCSFAPGLAYLLEGEA